MFKSINQICDSVKHSSNSIVMAVVCSENETILQAVKMAKDDGVIIPMLFGKKNKIHNLLMEMDINIGEYHIIDCSTPEEAAILAVKAAREESAHIILKGNIHTSTLMKAVLDSDTGIKESKCLTNICILEIPKYRKLLTIADGAILIQPTIEEKADMITSITKKMHHMGYKEVKVALLAASEEVSEKQPETIEAAILTEMYRNNEFPKYAIVDGPLSFDLSVDMNSVKNKGYIGSIAGDADLIIAHNIVVANSIVKAIRIFAGAESASLVLGAKAPIILTSRGASIKSKYLSILVAAATVGKSNFPGNK